MYPFKKLTYPLRIIPVAPLPTEQAGGQTARAARQRAVLAVFALIFAPLVDRLAALLFDVMIEAERPRKWSLLRLACRRLVLCLRAFIRPILSVIGVIPSVEEDDVP